MAAAMVHAMVKLGVREAAAPMLDRLRRGVLPPIDVRRTAAADEQYLAVTEGTTYDGCHTLMVFQASVPFRRRGGPGWRPSATAGDRGRPRVGPLGEELVKAMVAFDHQPAVPCLRGMVLASRQRFRAIVLTSLTTIAGLLPLLAERSLQAQVLIPLATSIAFGLMTSTVLVLLVIPSLHLILADFGFVQEGAGVEV